MVDNATSGLELPPTRDIAGFHVLPLDAPRGRRMVQLLIGLALFGVSIAWAIKASLGTNPWTVFHEGVAERTGISIGLIITIVGFLLLSALWLLKEPLGIGTVLNVTIIGPIADLTLAVTPDFESMWARIPLLIAAPILLGFGSGMYLGAGVGPGPRDGIMTALSRRGIETWKARTAVEMTALGTGFLLGGKVGLGTVWIAIAIGPCVQFFIPWFRIDKA